MGPTPSSAKGRPGEAGLYVLENRGPVRPTRHLEALDQPDRRGLESGRGPRPGRGRGGRLPLLPATGEERMNAHPRPTGTSPGSRFVPTRGLLLGLLRRGRSPGGRRAGPRRSPELRGDPGRRPRLRRPGQLRERAEPDAAPRPAGRRRPPLHRFPQQRPHVHPDSGRAADRSLPEPLRSAIRGGPERSVGPRPGAAPGGGDHRGRAEGGGLRHRHVRQVAPRVPGALAAHPPGLRRVPRDSCPATAITTPTSIGPATATGGTATPSRWRRDTPPT